MSQRDKSATGAPGCTVKAFQRVGVTAEITVIPVVECGPMTVTCLSSEVVPGHHRAKGHGHPECWKVTLYQELCVAVPVTFSAEAVCVLAGVTCGPASTDARDCRPCHDEDGATGSSSSMESDESDDSSGS